MNAVPECYAKLAQELKQWFSDPKHYGVCSVTHDRLTEMSKAGGEVDDDMLKHIHDSALRYIDATAENDVLRGTAREVFERQVWPEVCERASKNSGMAQFLLENALSSDFIFKFLKNVWHSPAKAVLPAHGVSETMLGKPGIIPRHDGMMPYVHDQSYRMIQYRTEVPQETMKKAKVIFFAGGGLLPELWTNDYPIGINGQRYVVWDQDETLRPFLEELLGGPLEEFGIELHIGDYHEALQDESQWGLYDCVIANGIMAYEIKALEDGSGFNMEAFEITIRGFYNLLSAGGAVFFDVQLLHAILLFDLFVLEWPRGMTVIPGFEFAVSLIKPILEDIGLSEMEFTHEPIDAKAGEKPAGMITMARKVA